MRHFVGPKMLGLISGSKFAKVISRLVIGRQQFNMFVCVDASCRSQQVFGHVGRISCFSGLNQY